MRTAAAAAAAIVGLVGLVWLGQGAGYIKGSFMTGDPRWRLIGLICVAVAVVALAALWLTRRREGDL